MIVMYQLTDRGKQLSHSMGDNSPEWRTIHYLARQHVATRDVLYSIGDAGVVAKLATKGIIEKA